ncbi:MAG: maltose ABC transporter substrate-binding protein [Flaviflexus sp.]|nr:maltose ABC transporter substrate-binding protein [Flaviflexus sp.]
MRRSIAFLAAAGLTLTMSACGSDDNNSEQTTDTEQASSEDAGGEDPEGGAELTVWVDSNREPAVSEAAKQYEDATGNSVRLVVKEFDEIRTEFQTQAPNDGGPDITVGAHDWLGEFYENGVVSPIELGDTVDDFNEVTIQAFTYADQVYGLPYAVENVALIRNTELAPEAPADYAEMVEMGKDAKYPFLIQTGEDSDPYTYYPFQTSFGNSVFAQNDDGTYSTDLTIADDAGIEFANWLREEGQSGTGNLDTAITYDVAIDAFSKGESPFIIGGPWMIQEFADAGLDLAVDPIPSAGGQDAQPFVGVQGFYVSAYAANPVAATDFLVNYIGSKDIQISLYEAGNRTPALTEAAEAITDDPLTDGFAKVAENAVPMPSIPEMGAVWQYWGKTEAQLIKGSASDPKAVWEKMADDITADLK